MTKRLILACAVAALSTAAAAQTAPKPVTRTDYLKTVDSHFSTADTNHDGFVSKAELTAQQQRELAQAKGRLNQQLQTKFNQLDTNKDGKLTLQEFLGAAPPLRVGENSDQLMQRLDTNRDGKMSAEEFRAPELAKFNKVDANRDGTVTPQEAQAAARK